MVLFADDAVEDPQYGLRFFMGVPVLHGVPRGYLPRGLLIEPDKPAWCDHRHDPDFVRTASREDILQRDLYVEVAGRKNLESHCIKLKAQLEEERRRRAGEEVRATKKLKLDTEHSHSRDTDEASQSSSRSADQGGYSSFALKERLREAEERSQQAEDRAEEQAEQRVRQAEERVRQAEEWAEERVRKAEEETRAAKKLKLDAEHTLTVEKNNTMKLRGLAQTWEPRLRPHLHGQPIIDPCSSEEWALFGWLEQTLDNVTEWYESGAAASLVEDDLKSHFPFNKDPSPGPKPTPYDLRIGPTVLTNVLASGKSMPRWREEIPDTMLESPNANATTKDPNGMNLNNCNGNTDWSTGESALLNVDRTVPPLKWMLNPDDRPILRWDTPSRTRSRTLEAGQSMPKNAIFFKEVRKENVFVA